MSNSIASVKNYTVSLETYTPSLNIVIFDRQNQDIEIFRKFNARMQETDWYINISMKTKPYFKLITYQIFMVKISWT